MYRSRLGEGVGTLGVDCLTDSLMYNMDEVILQPLTLTRLSTRPQAKLFTMIWWL